MASCDDDFSLLNDDNNSNNSNLQNTPHHLHHPHHHRLAASHHQQTFPHRFPTKATPIHAPPPLIRPNLPPPEEEEDEEEEEAEGFSDGAFCSQPDPKHTTSFHPVNPFSTNNNDSECDPNRSRVNNNVSNNDNNKRSDREELSDGGTPYNYNKRPKTGAAVGPAAEYRKDREEWSDTAISCLLDAYTEKFVQLNKGSLRGRDWEEVAAIVSERCEKQGKSVEQCKNKVDNLKKRFKLERHRMNNSGVSTSHWPWFKKMEEIVANTLPLKGLSEEDKSISGSAASNRLSKRCGTAVSSPSGQTNIIKTKVATPKWRRVVFKISGSSLVGSGSNSIDPKVAMLIAREISMACHAGVEVAVVVGGRNFFCGNTWVTSTGLDRCTAYQIGMMATVMNSILLQSALEKMGIQTRVQTAFSMPEVAEPYSRQRAIRHLEKRRVVIFGGIGAGTGNPLFSTDTAAALRASEINADAVLKGTSIDGVYDCESGNSSVPFEHLSFRDLASRGPSAMDIMAVTYCEENCIPVVIFNLHEPGNISRALCGEPVGTLVDQTGQIS